MPARHRNPSGETQYAAVPSEQAGGIRIVRAGQPSVVPAAVIEPAPAADAPPSGTRIMHYSAGALHSWMKGLTGTGANAL